MEIAKQRLVLMEFTVQYDRQTINPLKDTDPCTMTTMLSATNRSPWGQESIGQKN